MTAVNFVEKVELKSIAFDGTAGKGAVGVVPLFTVTGAVSFRLIGICTEGLVSAGGGTISVGTPGTVDGLIAVTTGTDLATGDIWTDGTPTTVLDTLSNSAKDYVIGDGADIQANVLVGDITDGTLVFTVAWKPLTAGASVVAA